MNEYVLEAKEFTLKFWQNQPVRIYLFGSWARGEAKRSSDVDIAIESREDMSFLIGEFREALENSCIVYNVDVVDMNFAAESLCKKIREEGIVWKD
ncbi:MAG: nucleotidyltransferase domain-containing protein [Selenomonadaceae bacterium]|uniref:nucleotidyltransferase family protein n=1 Tax=Anaerovibrio slackiae TaxID=2652309 RepID=UPI0038669932|nr:nucleotidyltransferase domain-containing protein [Selenomonadaceae bacterium]MBQ5845907.1 nucleotidyltransferase domain-containing protein [Selenomonadaceae bacterium]